MSSFLLLLHLPALLLLLLHSVDVVASVIAIVDGPGEEEGGAAVTSTAGCICMQQAAGSNQAGVVLPRNAHNRVVLAAGYRSGLGEGHGICVMGI